MQFEMVTLFVIFAVFIRGKIIINQIRLIVRRLLYGQEVLPNFDSIIIIKKRDRTSWAYSTKANFASEKNRHGVNFMLIYNCDVVRIIISIFF